MKNVPKAIIIHCSDVSYTVAKDQFDSINSYHRDVRGFPVSSIGFYVGYHRLITGGRNYQARLDTDEGAHCNQQIDGVSMNFQSLGICIGFDGDVEYPKQNEYELAKAQVTKWQAQYNIPNERVYFHRHFAKDKTCPGTLIGDEWLKNFLTEVSVKPIEQCQKQEAIIKAQQDQLTIFQRFFETLKNMLK